MTNFKFISSESHDDDCVYVRLDEPVDLDILRAEEGIVIDVFDSDEH